MANITSATWSATGAGIPNYYRERFLVGAAQMPMMYQEIFKVQASDRKVEHFSSFGGMQTWGLKTEGGDIDFQTPQEGYAISVTNLTYASGFSYSREAQEDEQYNELAQVAEDLGVGAAILIETTAANIFNRAFNASYTYGDGKELCATDHPVLITGGTEQNELTTAADLAYSSLEQSYIDMAATVDAAGKLSPQVPDTLIVPSALWVTAEQIASSPYDNSDFQVNVLGKRGLRIAVWNHLTDSDAFFLTDPRHKLYFLWRRPLMFERWATERSQVENYAGSMRFSIAVPEWRGVFGSPGTP
jgi:phage major head subunit gpT-like protein